MPRNLYGGCHAKKKSNKVMNQQTFKTTLFPDAGKKLYLALVTKVNGDGRYTVDAVVRDEQQYSIETYLAVLPGRLRRIARSIKGQCWVLVQPWDFTTTGNKADLVHLYDDSDVIALQRAGFMKFSSEEAVTDVASAVAAVVNNNHDEGDEELDISAI